MSPSLKTTLMRLAMTRVSCASGASLAEMSALEIPIATDGIDFSARDRCEIDRGFETAIGLSRCLRERGGGVGRRDVVRVQADFAGALRQKRDEFDQLGREIGRMYYEPALRSAKERATSTPAMRRKTCDQDARLRKFVRDFTFGTATDSTHVHGAISLSSTTRGTANARGALGRTIACRFA